MSPITAKFREWNLAQNTVSKCLGVLRFFYTQVACRHATERADREHTNIHPHTLHHCFATRMLEAEADERTIQC